MSSSTNVNLHRCDIAQLLSSINVDFRKCGVTQMPNSTDVDFHKCEIKPVSSYANNQSNPLGYRRFDFDKNIQYDEFSSSDVSGVDASKAAKASGSSASSTKTQAKGPQGKSALT